MQLRFASLVVVNLRVDFHLHDRAHTGRTKKGRPKTAFKTKYSVPIFLRVCMVKTI
jgi:hypothetical protein